jgi:TP901 family phage tail tape measure protein
MSIRINVGATFNARDLRAAQRELTALGRAGESASAKMGRLGDSMKRVGGQMQSVGRQMTRNVTAPIVALGVAGVKMAADFETSFGKIQGLVGVAAADIGELRDAARTLGPQFGVSANEAAEALFFITSAGLRGSQAIATLEASLKGSAIGLGDTATIADLATSAMNAFGSDVLDSTRAVDILTGAVRLGKLAPEELAQSIGSVLPVASAMGVTFNDVGAAFAAMSRTGTNAATASTQLGQILSALLKPSAEAEQTLGELGLSSAELRQQLREKGLLSVLMTLTDRFGENETAAGKVFGNIRALRGVLDLMGANVQDTISVFAQMADVTGITDEALLSVTDTAGFKLRVAMQELKGSLQDVGATLLPLVKDIADSLTNLADKFNNLSEDQQKFIIKALGVTAVIGPLLVVVGSLVVAIGAITVALGAMSVAMIIATGGLVLLGAAIGLVAFRRMGRDSSDNAKALEHEGRAAELAAAGYQAMADAELARARALRGGMSRGEQTTATRLQALADRYKAVADAAALVVPPTTDAADVTQDLGSAAGASAPKVVILTSSMRQLLQELNEVHADAGDSGAAIAQFSRELLAAGKITDQTASAAEKLAQTIRQNLDRSLAEGNRRLDEAKSKFEAYRDAIAGGIRSGNTLSDSARKQEDALQRVEDAQKDYNEALRSGDKQEITKTAAALASAKQEQQGFLGFLSLGVQTAEGFAGQIDALRLAGASMEVVQQIAELGAETGGRIAAELLAGGAAAIAQANQLVKAVEDASIRAGVAAAKQFHSAGIEAAKQFIAAIEATIPELQEVLNRIADMIARALGVRPNVDITGETTFITSGSTTTPTSGTRTTTTSLATASDPNRVSALGSPTFFASGGFVTQPTLGVVGEAGPEVVMPLDRFERNYGVGGSVVINVMGALDAEGVARQIERILRDSQRRTGGVFV